MEAKNFWESKTFWVNTIAIVAILSQYIIGREIFNAEGQVVLLAIANLIVRIFTNQPIK